MDQRLKKSRSAATGAAPVVTVHADAGVTVPVAVAALESDTYVPAGGACWSGAGLAQRQGVRLVSRRTSVRNCFGSPISSKAVVCGHCLVTLSLTIMKH